MTDLDAPIKKSPGFWRVAWRRYRTHKLGMLGLGIVLTLFLVGFCAPLLANDEPIATRYEGAWYFPGVVETIQNIPMASLVIKKIGRAHV